MICDIILCLLQPENTRTVEKASPGDSFLVSHEDMAISPPFLNKKKPVSHHHPQKGAFLAHLKK